MKIKLEGNKVGLTKRGNWISVNLQLVGRIWKPLKKVGFVQRVKRTEMLLRVHTSIALYVFLKSVLDLR
jgi:hypothetical protein